MSMYTKYYKVAGVTVEVRSGLPITENTFHPKFRQFEVDGPGDDNVLISHFFDSPYPTDELAQGAKEVYNKDQWRIFKTDNAWIYRFTSLSPLDPGHAAVGKFSHDHQVVEIYPVDIGKEQYRSGRFTALTLFNSDQILFSKLLCDRNGVIIHANGFDIGGNGILLAGVSGAGKSTLSQMLKKRGANILCDDRMFVRRDEDIFNIYGNWCHGTVPDTSALSAPLKAVFFLEQADENLLEKIEDRNAVTHRVLQALVRPFLSLDGWTQTFQTIEAFVRKVSCYRLQFDLSGDICDMIYDMLEGTSP